MDDAGATVLLTRPRDRSEEFAALCRARDGWSAPILISPILRIASIPLSLAPGDYDWFAVTSVHGADCLAGFDGLSGRPCYAVGDRTAAALDKTGLSVRTAGGTAADLFDLIVRDRPAGRGLFPRGRHVASDLAKRLAGIGFPVEEAVCYDQVSRPLSQEARSLLSAGGRVLVPLFSPRSASLLREAAPIRGPGTIPVALSGTVARAWGEDPPVAAVSDHPTAASMVDKLSSLLEA